MTSDVRPKVLSTGRARRGARGIPGLSLSAVLALAGGAGWLAFGRDEAHALRQQAQLVRALAVDDCAWESLRVGRARIPVLGFGDAVPARVAVDERRASRVGVPLSGRVVSVYVELGQRVARGDRLFTVASTELPALQTEVARAGVELDAARAEDARVQSMVEQRLLPAKEALASRARLQHAEHAEQAARARVRALGVSEQSRHEFTLRAPRAGVVVDKQVLSGQQVSAGQGLLQIAELDAGLFLIADVFETDLLGIAKGTEARVRWPGLQDAALETRVDDVAAVVDAQRHSVRVRMSVRDPRLRPNQAVEVRFKPQLPAGAVEVPSSAVVSDGAEQVVYVVGPAGRKERRSVIAGLVHDGRVVVLHGLRPDEDVIEYGGFLLENRVERRCGEQRMDAPDGAERSRRSS